MVGWAKWLAGHGQLWPAMAGHGQQCPALAGQCQPKRAEPLATANHVTGHLAGHSASGLAGHVCGRRCHLNTSAQTGTKRVSMVLLGRERQGNGEAQSGARVIQGVQGAWGTWLGGAWHLQSAPRGYSIASGSPRRPASARPPQQSG